MILTSDLSWNKHATYVINNANRVLDYLKRNFLFSSSIFKSFSLWVRSKLEYAASIWNSGATYLIDSLESVLNISARFILTNYNRTATVKSIKNNLHISSLAHRCAISSLYLFHYISDNTFALKKQPINPTSFVLARIGIIIRLGSHLVVITHFTHYSFIHYQLLLESPTYVPCINSRFRTFLYCT